MHRSGTSLVAKCFEVFGYGLGETLMAASDDNPKGFFEDLDVVELNDALLQDQRLQLGCTGIYRPEAL